MKQRAAVQKKPRPNNANQTHAAPNRTGRSQTEFDRTEGTSFTRSASRNDQPKEVEAYFDAFLDLPHVECAVCIDSVYAHVFNLDLRARFLFELALICYVYGPA